MEAPPSPQAARPSVCVDAVFAAASAAPRRRTFSALSPPATSPRARAARAWLTLWLPAAALAAVYYGYLRPWLMGARVSAIVTPRAPPHHAFLQCTMFDCAAAAHVTHLRLCMDLGGVGDTCGVCDDVRSGGSGAAALRATAPPDGGVACRYSCTEMTRVPLQLCWQDKYSGAMCVPHPDPGAGFCDTQDRACLATAQQPAVVVAYLGDGGRVALAMPPSLATALAAWGLAAALVAAWGATFWPGSATAARVHHAVRGACMSRHAYAIKVK